MNIKPSHIPNNPHFSSGPCPKRPDWDCSVLSNAILGRSHRSKEALERINNVLLLIRDILNVPNNYYIGIVPASDTGAIEMVLWNMLGKIPVEVLAWESFGKDWVNDVVNQLKIDDVIVRKEEYGEIVDLEKVNFKNDIVFTWNGTTSGVCVPNADWIDEKRVGLTICDATSAVFSMDLNWSKLDATTFSWQKVLGGEAQHGIIILSPRAIERLETYDPGRPIPKIFQISKNLKVNKKIFTGNTINTPSMLCIEDVLDSLLWVKKIGGLNKTMEKSKKNLAVVEDKIINSSWLEFLAKNKQNRSCTSICLKIKDALLLSGDLDNLKVKVSELLNYLEKNNIAFDINSYRDAPLGIRIWGGATVNFKDIEVLLQWLEWGYNEFIREK